MVAQILITGKQVSFTDQVFVEFETDEWFDVNHALDAYYNEEKEEDSAKDQQDKPEMKEMENLVDIDSDYEGGDPEYETLWNQRHLVKSFFKDQNENGYYVVNVRCGTIAVPKVQLEYIFAKINQKRQERRIATRCELLCLAALFDHRIRDCPYIDLDFKLIQSGYTLLKKIVGSDKEDVAVACMDKFQQSHFPYNKGGFDTAGLSYKELKYTVPKNAWIRLSSIKQEDVRMMCDIAKTVLAFNPTIFPNERFNKFYRDIHSHHRNNLGVVMKDRICVWKWNMGVLRDNGFEG